MLTLGMILSTAAVIGICALGIFFFGAMAIEILHGAR